MQTTENIDAKPAGQSPELRSTAVVSHVIKLSIKGADIELTKEEAIQLKDALAELLGDSKKEAQFDKIKRELERIRSDREPPTIIPQPYPVPVYPKWTDPWDRWPYREVWCSTDSTMRMAVEARACG